MNFKELRKSKGITQTALALRIGSKQSTIAMWETGASVPKMPMLVLIAKALGVTMDDVVNSIMESRSEV
jgi:transcriptional regulator with XRE-family HTH domain